MVLQQWVSRPLLLTRMGIIGWNCLKGSNSRDGIEDVKYADINRRIGDFRDSAKITEIRDHGERFKARGREGRY
jgi:hypothetical protein